MSAFGTHRLSFSASPKEAIPASQEITVEQSQEVTTTETFRLSSPVFTSSRQRLQNLRPQIKVLEFGLEELESSSPQNKRHKKLDDEVPTATQVISDSPAKDVLREKCTREGSSATWRKLVQEDWVSSNSPSIESVHSSAEEYEKKEKDIVSPENRNEEVKAQSSQWIVPQSVLDSHLRNRKVRRRRRSGLLAALERALKQRNSDLALKDHLGATMNLRNLQQEELLVQVGIEIHDGEKVIGWRRFIARGLLQPRTHYELIVQKSHMKDFDFSSLPGCEVRVKPPYQTLYLNEGGRMCIFGVEHLEVVDRVLPSSQLAKSQGKRQDCDALYETLVDF